MSRNGNGKYTLPQSYNPVVPGTLIESDWANTTLNDVAAALTASLTADGQTTPTANQPMGGFHHTGVSDPTARGQYLTLGMAQDGRYNKVTIVGGTGDNITGTCVGWTNSSPAAYTAGMVLGWVQPSNNTGAVTLNVSGLGARTVLDNTQAVPIAGDLVAGDFYLAYYSGTAFILISDTTTTAANTFAQSSITGWERPVGGVYAPAVIASGTTVDIPAGVGIIVTPGSDTSENVRVPWTAQTVTLLYAATAWSTNILIDSTGSPVQYPGLITTQVLRDHIYICTVEHASGSATNILTRPAIFGDDEYLARDTMSLIGNRVVSGGQVSGNALNLTINMLAGTIFQAGISPNTPQRPNFLDIPAVTAISFIPVYINGAGVNTQVAATTTVDVLQYNPGGLSALTAITATNSVIHRLYWLLGKFFLVYGQAQYQYIPGSTANNTNAVHSGFIHLAEDRSRFLLPAKLNDAVLVAEIIVAQNVANFGVVGESAFINSSSQQYLFGGAQAIAEAPAGPTVWGRNATSGWVAALSAASPSFTGTPTITNAAPKFIENMNPVGAGWAGMQVQQLGLDWFNIEVTQPDDKVYFRSYDPATGVLRFTTTYDLATGAWSFPTTGTVGGNALGNVIGPVGATDGGVALYDGITGQLLKDGGIPGTAFTHDVQTSPTDATAGRVLLVGAFGLGGTSNIALPAGTTLDRPGAPAAGDFRYNTSYGTPEYYSGAAWYPAPPAFGWKQGLELSNNPALPAYGITVATGIAASWDATVVGGRIYTISKRLDAVWTPGGTEATPLGGRAVGTGASAYGKWWGVFLLINPDDGSTDVGFDTSATAANLMAVVAGNPSDYGFTTYRRLGWVMETTGAGYALRQFKQAGNTFRPTNAMQVGLSPQAISSGGGEYSVAYGSVPDGILADISISVSGSSSSYVKLYPATQTPAAPITATNFDITGGSSGSFSIPMYTGKIGVISSSSLNAYMCMTGWTDDFSRGT